MWNIWKFDWVQYNASVSQPMARNVGEAVGTGATYHLVDRYGRPVPPTDRYRTRSRSRTCSASRPRSRPSQPPAWPEDLLGRIDAAKVARGRQLFDEHCAGLPWPARRERRHDGSRSLSRARPRRSAVGDPVEGARRHRHRPERGGELHEEPRGPDADRPRRRRGPAAAPRTARRGRRRGSWSSSHRSRTRDRGRKAGDGPAELSRRRNWRMPGRPSAAPRTRSPRLDQIDLRSVSIGEGLTIVGTLIRNRYYDDHRYSDRGARVLRRVRHARPAAGGARVQAAPAEGRVGDAAVPPQRLGAHHLRAAVAARGAARPTFYVGTHLYDPRDLGYVTERPAGNGGRVRAGYQAAGQSQHRATSSGRATCPFDESKPAETQYQGGVIGPELTPDERYAIIEYLKVGPDEPPTRRGPRAARLLCAAPPESSSAGRCEREQPRDEVAPHRTCAGRRRW